MNSYGVLDTKSTMYVCQSYDLTTYGTDTRYIVQIEPYIEEGKL